MQSAERRIQSSAKSEAVITCFLSLILLIILSLVSVCLESARLSGARILTESYTRMARDSVMAEYSGVLFDRYHLFAYNSRSGTREGIRQALETGTEYYINRNLQAEKQMLWSPALQKVNVEEYELLTDEAGTVFSQAAVNYMQYRGVSAIVERLFSSLGIFQEVQETTKLLETRAVAEEALAEIDYSVLELFETVDGFVRDEEGLKQNIWGKVKIKEHFVKRVLTAVPTMKSTQINHPELFEAIKNRYVNPEDVFERMGAYLTQYEELQLKLGDINRQLEELGAEDVPDTSEHVLELATLGAEKAFYLAQAELIKQKYAGSLREWRSTVSGCMKAGTKALESLSAIRTKQKLAESKVLRYEDELLQAVQWLDTSLYEELAEGLDTMKQYIGLDAVGAERIIDIDRMEQSIEKNVNLLSQILAVVESNVQEGIQKNERERLVQMIDLIIGYSHDGLCFDYSGLYLRAQGVSPVESVRELLMRGVAALVLTDTGSVSEAILNRVELPNRLQYLLQPDESEDNEDYAEGTFFKDALRVNMAATSVSSTLSTMNKSSPIAGVSEWVVKEGKEIVHRTLFLSYLTEHFTNYIKQTEQQKDSVLMYEQEYILCGNSKDALNLYEVIGKILLVRMSFSLVHVLCDAEKTGLAGELALGLLGVTGLPVLVNIMKILILFVWAVEEALVETAAILQGKRLALVPSEGDFVVSFSELALMSRSRILDNAKRLQDKERFSFGYSEYLLLFLLVQKEEVQCARMLALIQENLALEECGFKVSQMVSSFAVKAEYLLPEVFTALPFSRRKTGGYII